MNKRLLLITAAIGLIFLIGWSIGRRGHDHAGESAAQMAEGGQAAAEVWTCSMHPQIRAEGPGKCPICGMDLIPVDTSDDGADEGELPQLRVSARAAALMRVQTWPVERRAVAHELRLLGQVDYDETRLATLSAYVAGRIDRLYVNFTGTTVSQGQELVDLYSPELYAAQTELHQARRSNDAAAAALKATTQRMLDAAREKLRLLGLADEQIRDMELQKEPSRQVTIRSPLDGTITERLVTEGSYVETGEAIYRIADLSQVWVNLLAYESDLSWVTVGDTLVFTTKSFAGERFEGTIAFIDPILDEQRRTVRVRVDVPNPEGKLKPGMFVRGTVAGISGETLPLVMPATAPLITGKRAVVYVQLPDPSRPVFEMREVALGPRAGDYYIIEDGLAEGELVVTQGNFKIDSELQIRGRPSMMAPPAPVEAAPALAEETPAALPASDVPEAFAGQVRSLIDAYLALAEALAADDLGKAQVTVAETRAALDAVDMKLVTGAGHQEWMRIEAPVRDWLEAMGKGETLAGIRKHLHPLSVQLARAAALFPSGEALYLARCPMPLDDRGADWLQKAKEIRNPYYGDLMLTCGDIVKEIKPENGQ